MRDYDAVGSQLAQSRSSSGQYESSASGVNREIHSHLQRHGLLVVDDHRLQRQEDSFLDWDCSLEGFEGIRAQDILPLLLERFQPSVFLAWGYIIDVFIDRGFGHHFRQQSEWDLHFIDMVQAMDHAAITSGRISPTHMLARFQKTAPSCVHEAGIGPHEAIRRP